MLTTNPELLDLKTGRGGYAEQPPSSYHIYFWTIGDARAPLDVAGALRGADTKEASPSVEAVLAERAVRDDARVDDA